MKIVTIEGPALGALADAIANNTIYRLRVAEDGDSIKFKLNEGTWTPPFYTDDNR